MGTPKIDFREILGAVRFSTFTTVSAPFRHADSIEQCRLSEVIRKRFAQAEFFSV
jgi:hypothetical protein